MSALQEKGIPVIHTLHDLDPHPGSLYGSLLHVWNRRIARTADHVLVHGHRYAERVRKLGAPTERITYVPLLHLFLGHTWLGQLEQLTDGVSYEPMILFFGRLERYKGLDNLLTAWSMMMGADGDTGTQLLVAGPGRLERIWAGALPASVEFLNRLISDEEAIALFRRAAMLVLPYTGATQSALIPAAYFFRKPVLVSPSGALHEYVEDGRTGWVVESAHPPSLARCLAAAIGDIDRLARMGEAGRVWYEGRRAQEEATLLGLYTHMASHR